MAAGRRSSRLIVSAELSDKGRKHRAQDVEVKRIMGEGSYGQCFEGLLYKGSGSDRVVLKRVKSRIEGAEQMGQMEHLLNVYASKAAPDAIANFMGYLEVKPSEATTRLTQGLWLIWKYEGAQTLGSYLKRRDCIRALAADLGVSEAAAVPTVMKQLLENLQALHKAGLVHRDVKPANIIFSEDDRRFKLIDLGACADLRSGTNFIPDESILDPMYCPPEQYCLPTDAPHLAKQSRAIAAALSPMVWAQHKPDRFDSFSAGLVLMQLALPKLRTSNTLRSFSQQMVSCNHDLELWRERHPPPPRETDILDAADGAGWELARTLLRPRLVVADQETGAVNFVRGGAQRVSARAALRHPFIRRAEQEGNRTSTVAGWFGRITGTISDDDEEGTRMGTTPAGPASTPRRWGSGLVTAFTGGSGSIRAGRWSGTGSGSVSVVAANVAASQPGTRGGTGSYVSAGAVKREQLARSKGTGSTSVGGTGSTASRRWGGGYEEAPPPPKRRGIGAALFSAIMGPRRKAQAAQPAKPAPAPAAAAAPAAPAASGSGSVTVSGGGGEQQPSGSTKVLAGLGRAVGIWSRASGKLFNLEARIKDQADATKRQTSVVKALEVRVRAGQASPEDLVQEQTALAAMTEQLTGMTSEFRTLYRGVLGGITGRKKRVSTKTAPKNRPARRPAAAAVTAGGDDDGETEASMAAEVVAEDVTVAANKAVAAGLRFTGQALGIATNMVASIEGQAEAARARTRDATSGAARIAASPPSPESQQARKPPPIAVARQGTTLNAQTDSRALSRAFMEMLRDLNPPLSTTSRWSATRERIRSDPRFKAVPQGQREKLFGTYLQAVKQLEDQAKERAARARQAFQDMLKEANIGPDSQWEQSRPVLELNPSFTALPENERRMAFDAAVAEKRRQAAAAQSGERQFRQLLLELQPPITASSTWASVKRLAWADERFDSVTEERRRDLFEMYRSMVAEEEAPPPTSVQTPAAGGGGTGDTATLTEQRQRIAAQLAELDSKLQQQDAQSAVNNSNGIPVDTP